MRCLIIDDEAPALLEMRNLLAPQSSMEIVGEAADVDAALVLTESLRPDVVFLDVQLRGETGFDYLSRCSNIPPHIVFVTAFDKYAVRAFECNALDYLLKPVTELRLAGTLRRIERHAHPIPKPANDDDRVYLKTSAFARFVSWRNVHCIISDGNYTRVFLADGSTSLILRPLKDWLRLAPGGYYLQVHRTAIVRRSAIREVQFSADQKRVLLLESGQVVGVGRDYWRDLKDTLQRD